MSEINITELNKLRSHIDKNKKYLDKNLNSKPLDDDKKNTVALSMSILIDYFELNQDEAYDSITDGADDNKIDALYYSEEPKELNELIVIQSKYKKGDDTGNYKKGDGTGNVFKEGEIKLCIESCKKILIGQNFTSTNPILKNKLDEYRKLLKENDNPPISIKLLFATNGIIHEGHKKLNEVKEFENSGNKITFIDATEYGNKQRTVNGKLAINLKSNEDKTDSIFTYSNEMEGRLVSCSILALMEFYKESGTTLLLNNNVRFTLARSKINKDIENSFIDNPEKFCFLNNGITLICKNYQIGKTGEEYNKIQLKEASIINGGQTVSTLYDLYENDYESYKDQFEKAKILIRIYKSPEEYILDIAKATNSQNPINVVDLHSNDPAQKAVKTYFEKKGVGLITKAGEDTIHYDDTIRNESLLQVYASLYGDEPAKAKVSKKSIFIKYYDLIFNENTNEETSKKLYRCYEIFKFIENEKRTGEKVVISHANFSLIYTMKKLCKNIINENIPDKQIQVQFKKVFPESIEIINEIIKKKEIDLGAKFSLNNLFKGNEIKDLIDIKIENITT